MSSIVAAGGATVVTTFAARAAASAAAWSRSPRRMRRKRKKAMTKSAIPIGTASSGAIRKRRIVRISAIRNGSSDRSDTGPGVMIVLSGGVRVSVGTGLPTAFAKSPIFCAPGGATFGGAALTSARFTRSSSFSNG